MRIEDLLLFWKIHASILQKSISKEKPSLQYVKSQQESSQADLEGLKAVCLYLSR